VQRRVLIVDDEADVGRLLSFALGEAGFTTEVAASGERALELALKLRPHVVILDLMLPGLSGFEVCRRLREMPAGTDAGVLMLTARGDEYDRVAGLEMGADDYVVKPFSVREVLLRVQALVKRLAEKSEAQAGASTAPPGRKLALRGLEVDLRTYEVRLDGELLSLRPLELRLLATLLGEPGRVFSRAELLQEVWGISDAVSTRTVDVHVKRLREKLGRAAELVDTVHGFGYRARP
jgi:two-component system, OmpR family, phosphate regulon response regulator PhoB